MGVVTTEGEAGSRVLHRNECGYYRRRGRVSCAASQWVWLLQKARQGLVCCIVMSVVTTEGAAGSRVLHRNGCGYYRRRGRVSCAAL